MNSDKLSDYICLNPFMYLDVQFSGNAHLCCPSWLPTNIREIKDSSEQLSLTDAWNSPIVNDIRGSIIDGSYKFCNHSLCPSISSVKSGVKPYNFVHKNDFNREAYTTPTKVLYGQDRSCNLKCPSCRTDVIPNDKIDSDEHAWKKKIQEEIEESFGKTITSILMTGSGDPIYSKLYREFLQTFKKEKYPNIEKIILVTNGVLLDEKMWNSFACTEYIDTLDISFDAGTQHTYENITRLNGDWNRLVSNVKYIASLTDRPRHVVCSMVVSKYNFKEMKLLYDLIESIFHDSISQYTINYRQIVHWGSGAYSLEQIHNMQVFNPTHSNHADFLKELNTVAYLPNVSHNFHHLIADN